MSDPQTTDQAAPEGSQNQRVPSPVPQQHRRIILLVETASTYGRGCLHGIARYARAHGGWSFFHGTRYLTKTPSLVELRKWNADGIIARLENSQIKRLVSAIHLPVVDIRGPQPVKNVPGIYTDDRAVIEMAATHLLSNGLRHLAFCGYPGVDFSDARSQAFAQLERNARFDIAVFAPRGRARKSVGTVAYERRGTDDRADLQAWLRALPKPVGIIACNDTRARQILEACAAVNLKVPYDCAVVGVDDDDVLCELSNPPLSSIVPNVETIGFEAAALLDRMIDGERVPMAPILMPPIALQVRASSDTTVLTDPAMVAAVRLIRSRIGEGINVKQLLSEVHISRSTLERQFREQLGCTPYEYITRCRIDRVKQLLIDTNYPINRITAMTGFRNVAHMTAVFRVRTGQTPKQYRVTSA